MERLTDGVWWLEADPRSPFSANVFLVEDGDVVTLIDVGLPWDAGRLRSCVEKAGFSLGEIDRVLLTHFDLDHVGGLSRLAPELDAPVYAGELDARLAAGEWHPPWSSPKGAFHRLLRRAYSVPASLPVERLADGDRIGGFTAYHTPGHNPGHMAYVNESLGVALLGDLAWTDEGGFVPPFWWDSYDLDALYESAREFARRAPSFAVAASGHGRPIENGGDRAFRQFAETLA